MTPPWGHRVTFSVYVPGEPDDDTIGKVVQDVAEAAERVGALAFVGVAMEVVETEPTEQVGS